jgi:hypothetical protein
MELSVHLETGGLFNIPTEPFSSRRVRWIFARQLSATGAQVMIDIIPAAGYTSDDWWLNKDGRNKFLSEITKYVYYRIRYTFARCENLP